MKKTEKKNSQENEELLYTEEEKQHLPMSNELDPGDISAHVKVAFAANKMKARLSLNKNG